METIAFQFGYLGLFIVSFLAATLMPFVAETLVIAMPRLGFNIWLVALVATLGSFCGSLTNYAVGLKGSDFLLSRYITISAETLTRAETFFTRWGPIALFFSWVPFIGDPLTAVAGALHIDLRVFSFWVLFGKTLRSLALVGLTQQFFN